MGPSSESLFLIDLLTMLILHKPVLRYSIIIISLLIYLIRSLLRTTWTFVLVPGPLAPSCRSRALYLSMYVRVFDF